MFLNEGDIVEDGVGSSMRVGDQQLGKCGVLHNIFQLVDISYYRDI